MSINVNGALRWDTKYLNGLFIDEKGMELTSKECTEYLLECKSKGWRVIPFSDNCEGFDYQNGCPGHPVKEDLAV